MIYAEKYNIPGLLVLIDFEKAFDMVEWPFLFDTLKQFNFDHTYIAWIKLLYTSICSCTINNGYLSERFNLSRGIRQGCRISALLFILVAEVLSVKLRANNETKGIKINDYEYRIVQLAEDTTIFVKDLNSFELSINAFLNFERIAGLKLNLEKCEIIDLGPIKLLQSDIPEHLHKIKVNKGPFKTLGIWFAKDHKQCKELNYGERLKKNKLHFTNMEAKESFLERTYYDN